MCDSSSVTVRRGAIAVGLLLTAGTVSPQDQPVFRSKTDVVQVTVIVRDAKGAFTPDLTIDDFDVRENGEPQKIQTLYRVAPPNAGAGGAASAAEAGAGVRPAARTFVFLFDMEHISPVGLTRARDAVLRFAADRLMPSDLTGMMAVGGTGQSNVSGDRHALAENLKRLKPRSDAVSRTLDLREWPRIVNEAEAVQIGNNDEEALRRALERACNESDGACNTEGAREAVEAQIHMKGLVFVREARAAAQRSIAALDGIGRSLGALPGRKTVIWISEGTFSDEITEQVRQAAYRASQSGVGIYALEPRGLARRTAGSLDQYPVADVGMDVLLGAAEDAADLLAVGSGGLAIRNENNLERALRAIENDTSTYYVLGYAASDARERSEYRRLSVRVRRPGLSVRARHGYMAPREVVAVNASAPAGAPTPAAPLPSSVPASEPPVDPPDDEPPAVTATGTIVAAPAAAVTGSVRLRPDAENRVETLATGGTAAAGVLAYRGWDAYQRGDVEAALAAFTQAAAQPDVRPWVLYALGLSQAAVGRPLDAVASWERVREAAPEFLPIYIDLADTYVQLSELSKALAVLRDAEKRWPKDPEIHSGIGVIHVRRGALDDAIAAFSKAAEAAPEEALGYFNLARAYELRYLRARRYVSSQRRWVAPDDDRQKAANNYERCVKIGGPYAQQAAEAIARLEWSKN